MNSFFAEHKNIYDDKIILEDNDYNHIKNVLRLKVGEDISVSSGDNYAYICKIKAFEDDQVICDIIQKNELHTELPIDITIFQGLPKGDKMDLIVQKSVELGVKSIVPVSMKRSVVKLDAKKAASKVTRWNTIALNASQQSKRAYLPEVEAVMTFKEAINYAKEYDYILLPYENASGFAYTKQVIETIKKPSKVAVFIGPEGGFDIEEVELAKEANASIISLGKRILRTETVALMMMSIFTYLFED